MFIKQEKSNIKYLLIVIILTSIIGGGALAYEHIWLPQKIAQLLESENGLQKEIIPEEEEPEVESPEVIEDPKIVSPEDPDVNPPKKPDGPPEYFDKASCENAGGAWFRPFVSPDSPDFEGVCNMPTSDKGKACTDSIQCQSFCEAPKGTKYGTEVTGKCYGYMRATCMQIVKNGIADAEWCQ